MWVVSLVVDKVLKLLEELVFQDVVIGDVVESHYSGSASYSKNLKGGHSYPIKENGHNQLTQGLDRK